MDPLDHTRNQTQVVFCRENVDPDLVTQLLGFAPSKALKVGEPTRIWGGPETPSQMGVWKLDLPGPDSGETVEEQLARWVCCAPRSSGAHLLAGRSQISGRTRVRTNGRIELFQRPARRSEWNAASRKPGGRCRQSCTTLQVLHSHFQWSALHPRIRSRCSASVLDVSCHLTLPSRGLAPASRAESSHVKRYIA